MPLESEFAGYPVHADAGPCPGGRASEATHPTLQAPVVLRRYRPDWTAPADTATDFAHRGRHACTILHPNLVLLHDVGEERGEAFAVVEPFLGSTLDALVRDIGPMPTALACDYIRQAALGLQAAHDRGVIHGDVRPRNLVVGPLVESSRTKADGSPLFRPAAEATVKVFELGLVPLRPTTAEWAAGDPLAADVLAFLPPERATDAEAAAAGDVYGLGASLYFLLAGRPPFHAASAVEIVAKIAAAAPAALARLRPDLPPSLVALVARCMAKHPVDRPDSAAAVAAALDDFVEVPLTPALFDDPEAMQPDSDAPTVAGDWSITPYDGPATAEDDHRFPSHDYRDDPAGAPTAARKSALAAPPGKISTRTWLLMGGVLWCVVVPLLWFVLLSQNGCFGGAKKDDGGPTKGKVRKTGN